MAYLLVTNGDNPQQQFPLDAAQTIIGRHPSCDIVLDLGSVSRQHAQITREGDQYFVEDLGSRNKTYLNGTQVEGRQLLRDQDQLQICEVTFTFRQGALAPSEPVLSGDSAGSTLALMVDDANRHSTIMSRIDVSRSGAGVRITVNPEIKLRALLEITQDLAKSLAMEQVLPKILDSLFKVFLQADRGFIVLQGDNGTLIPKAVKYRRDPDEDTLRISRTVVRQVMDSKEAILSADATADPKFAMSESIADFRIRSLMCAPLISPEGRALGVIQIDTLDQRHRFQDDDLEVLASVAAQAAIAVERAQLHEQALRQQQVERDLQLAHIVQQGFLPRSVPEVPGYQFFDFYDPANQVGGDLFDYVPLPGNRIAVVLGDVSGKGVSAALLMAKVSAEARFLLATSPPAAALTDLNRAFARHGWDDRFVTMIVAVLDSAAHEAILVNAGHMAPYLRRADGQVRAVGDEVTGVPLGVDPDTQYAEFRHPLEPGDVLIAFTDGITEAQNAQRDFYGFQRLEASIRSAPGDPIALGRSILEDVRGFVRDHRQFDDMCLLCFGRQA
jgi:sigma-B regulation protein RsbU (phosphoserine phosphatase)